MIVYHSIIIKSWVHIITYRRKCIVDDFNWQIWISIIELWISITVSITELWISAIVSNSIYPYPNMDIHDSVMDLYNNHRCS